MNGLDAAAIEPKPGMFFACQYKGGVVIGRRNGRRVYVACGRQSCA